MKLFITVLLLLLSSVAWSNTSITLTQEQIDKVLAENTVPIVPPVQPPIEPPVEPPVEPPIEPPSHCGNDVLPGVLVSWKDFWGVAFPDPISMQTFTDIPRNGYLAIEFNTGSVPDTGLLSTIESVDTSGRRLGSISTCPGDFDVADDRCLHVWGTGGEIYWSTQGYYRACVLEPNTTYYFNITFTDGYDPDSSECLSTKCITKLRTYNPQ